MRASSWPMRAITLRQKVGLGCFLQLALDPLVLRDVADKAVPDRAAVFHAARARLAAPPLFRQARNHHPEFEFPARQGGCGGIQARPPLGEIVGVDHRFDVGGVARGQIGRHAENILDAGAGVAERGAAAAMAHILAYQPRDFIGQVREQFSALAQFFGQRDGGGDVGRDAAHAHRLTLRVARRHLAPAEHPDVVAPLVAQAVLDLVHGRVVVEMGLDGGANPVHIVGVDTGIAVGNIGADLVVGIAEHGLPCTRIADLPTRNVAIPDADAAAAHRQGDDGGKFVLTVGGAALENHGQFMPYGM